MGRVLVNALYLTLCQGMTKFSVWGIDTVQKEPGFDQGYGGEQEQGYYDGGQGYDQGYYQEGGDGRY